MMTRDEWDALEAAQAADSEEQERRRATEPDDEPGEDDATHDARARAMWRTR